MFAIAHTLMGDARNCADETRFTMVKIIVTTGMIEISCIKSDICGFTRRDTSSE